MARRYPFRGAEEVVDALRADADPEKAEVLSRFFKTGRGEYGEGDIFLGVVVPKARLIARRYRHLGLPETGSLIQNRIHEVRLVAVLILVERYRTETTSRDNIVSFYLRHRRYVNNWDLVDLSAPKILGEYLADKDKAVLYKLAGSKDLWDRRIAIMSTLAFIRRSRYDDTLRIAEILLEDRHDLIHKAVGWMLREVGKRDPDAERAFLSRFHARMPRTMLRYAIEKFDERERRRWLTV